jgi:manganese/zinc/iron transport system permease protein
MTQAMFEIVMVATLVAAACALPGCFLVLRRAALMSDAISHTILFGIVIGFMIVGDIHSPVLLIMAAGAGVLTVSLVELLLKTGRVRQDAAMGLVFPALFSIAVILITRNFANVHLDTDAVLLGELAFAPFNRTTLAGINLPTGIWTMGAILALNLGLIGLFYKELKISAFDAGLAATLGFMPALIHYGLMLMVSITTVGAFEHVGAILVVALMVAPPAAAYLLTDRLSRMLAISVGIAILSALGGYWMARALDINIASAMATFTGIIFLLVLCFAPERGLVAKRVQRERRRLRFSVETLLVHLSRHESDSNASSENSLAHLTDELTWSRGRSLLIVSQAERGGYLTREADRLILTTQGRELASQVSQR